MRIWYFGEGRWRSVIVPQREAEREFLRLVEAGWDQVLAVPLQRAEPSSSAPGSR